MARKTRTDKPLPNITVETPENQPHCLSVDRVAAVVNVLTSLSVQHLMKFLMERDPAERVASQTLREAALLVVDAVASNEHETREQALEQLSNVEPYQPDEHEQEVIYANHPEAIKHDEDSDSEPVDLSDEAA